MAKTTIINRDFNKITFSRSGNYVKYAGGNARKRNNTNIIPPLQQSIEHRRKTIKFTRGK